MFPMSAPISESDTLLYNSPGENHLTTSPTQGLPGPRSRSWTTTRTPTPGACPTGPIAPPVPIPVKECFSEFLPTSDYVGLAGVNASPPSAALPLTARDLRLGGGGNNAADTTLLLAPGTGPFLVTSPNTAVTLSGRLDRRRSRGTWPTRTSPPVGTANVKISLSTDGGHTYPFVLAASTPNDGSRRVTSRTSRRSDARIKVEAIGNVFFDVSNADFTITDTVKPTISASVSPAANAAGWHKSNVTVTLTAEDDAMGSGVKSITYSAVGAQPIPSTTVNGSSTNVVISSEGVTTLSFFATDNAGNTSDVGSVTIKLDKTAPEAYLRFDPAKTDIAVFGRDSLSGITADALSPSSVRRVQTGDRNLRAEIRTYDLVDAAGNTLQLVDSVGLTKDDATAGIQTLQYNGGAVTRPPYSLLFFEWTLKKNAFDTLDQTFFVSPSQSSRATWRAKDDLTKITTVINGVETRTTVPGMFLLRLATNKGALSIESSP